MPLLLESLAVMDGSLRNLEYHLQRMERSAGFYYGQPAPDPRKSLNDAAAACGEGLWKVRLFYDREIRKVEWARYTRRSYENVVLVDGAGVDYSCKRADRGQLDELTEAARAAGADTALIVRNGLVTDFSHANAAFFDGRDWWTPAQPLLEGTCRARLLDEGRIRPGDIPAAELDRYSEVSPLNALMELGDIRIPVNSIRFLPDMEVD